MRYRDGGKSQRPRLRRGFDDERHIGRVLDFEVEGGPIASGPLKDVKNGLHYATSASASVGFVVTALLMAFCSFGFRGCGLCGTRMMVCVMPIEYRGDMGCGDVVQPIAEKFNRDMP